MILRIGLSYHNADESYDAYATALERRAAALGLAIEVLWLAGKARPAQIEALDSLHGVCLTGGADVDPATYGRADALEVCKVDAERDSVEWQILERLAMRPVPVLAICRGAQIFNVFHGGTLVPDLGDLNATHRGSPIKAHAVSVEAGTVLAACVGAGIGETNSSHHQAVERVAGGFRVTARALDGTIEAFEPTEPAARPFTLAVQWHPELMAAGLPLADGVLDGFLRAVSLDAGPAKA